MPFPYYAESWTGQEYLAAAHLIFAGMAREGFESVRNVRARYDGERRNPWNEPECGHHYARAMSSWSTLLAASGFHYHGGDRAVSIKGRPAALLLEHGDGVGRVSGDGHGRDAARGSRHVGVQDVHCERQTFHAGPHREGRGNVAPVKPVIVVIGGFLGAGKTTLILSAARILRQRGTRVAVILNDQGGDLVDTRLVESHGLTADQVTGGCFCCRFPDLMDALARVEAHAPEVIFAEAVGSCTDIAATTLRPLLRDYPDRYRVAPLTVVVHERPEDGDLQFLYDHQAAEADVVFHRGDDVAAWLAEILGGAPAATRGLPIDYARYAEAEAALAWFNARVLARGNSADFAGACWWGRCSTACRQRRRISCI